MSYIQPPLITNNPFSPWAEGVYNTTRENLLGRSCDMDIGAGPFGKYTGLRSENKYVPLWVNYRGEFDPTASYFVNDVVRVLPGKDYWSAPIFPWVSTPTPDANKEMVGEVTLFGETVVYKTKYFVPIPGTYICVYPIPGLESQLLYVNRTTNGAIENAVYSYNDTLPAKVLANISYIRFWDVNYFPVWPEYPNIAELNNADMTKANGRYWDLMSLLPTSTYMCLDGVTTNAYTDTQEHPSGSANYTGSAP